MKSTLGLDTADPESELTVSFILSGVIGSLSSWYASGKRLPQDRMVAHLQRTMAAVLSSPSGEVVPAYERQWDDSRPIGGARRER